MLTNQICLQLDCLGLQGMAKTFRQQLEQTTIANLSFEDRFALLIEAEKTARDNKKIDRLLKLSKMRQSNASLEDIDYRPKRGLEISLISNLAACDWIKRRQNLILTGATGTGKSWLACAFGKQACRSGFSTLFTTATQLYEQLTCSQADGSLAKFRRQLIKTKLLIIDDLGIGGIDVQIGPLLLDIVDQQSQVGSLLITSQFPTTKWYDLFNDPTVADAILDRIVHRAHYIELKGESMRKLKSKDIE